jgi:enamine deaminase RidA (YjgF/YER057c/UK114 family)
LESERSTHARKEHNNEDFHETRYPDGCARHDDGCCGVRDQCCCPGHPTADALAISRVKSTHNFNSLAIRHGNIVYTGGVQATDFKQDFVGQTKQAFARIDDALAALGSSKENLLSATIRTKTIANKPAFNKVWLEWLGPAGLPTRVYAVVADLDEGSLVEIQVTAACAERA